MIGHGFDVQVVRFLGIEECRPCHGINLALAAGTEDWLRVCILTHGILRVFR